MLTDNGSLWLQHDRPVDLILVHYSMLCAHVCLKLPDTNEENHLGHFKNIKKIASLF